ncbi:helix-turn-helix domain-containing protein [Aliarcobacter cryaerophilus]|uniref:helix-turn-helix transcriptional regulator n=1 Tax=Aliarcobacter cryaerophilus TaxID=28198 RepID=UPI0021B3E525|nr:helix-turn-helix domain-containing protein [Aliarcobacter cryaerophilus]MCT7505387.1 helix-turn-helix domain-containing protein [Aliarcobacter cryaerophilus]
MVENITPKFMRAKELAKYLGIGLSTVWLYAKQEKITPKKISDRVTLFEVAEVEKALIGA